MKIPLTLLLFFLFASKSVNAQWQTKWTSPQISSTAATGWVAFKNNGGDWENRFYSFSETSFNIMSSAYSSDVEYSYTLSQEEIDSGYLIYSLEYDLTGDGIVEFYSLIQTGTTDSYRQGFKIFDITTGNILLEKNDESYYYSYPTVWDVDNDGILECSLTEYDYPGFSSYQYIVYDTGITTSAAKTENTPKSFGLSQNYPNPFGKAARQGSPSTTISYTVAEPGNYSLDIFSITGEKIIQLVNDFKQNGVYKAEWNGKNSFGRLVASGKYIYSLKFNGKIISKKMILIK